MIEMTATGYLKEKARLCNSNGCYTCPFSSENNGQHVSCDDLEEHFPELAVQILDEWVKANPPLTNFKKLQEVFGIGNGCVIYDNSPRWIKDWFNKEYKEDK